jgi:hypothetical protein
VSCSFSYLDEGCHELGKVSRVLEAFKGSTCLSG